MSSFGSLECVSQGRVSAAAVVQLRKVTFADRKRPDTNCLFDDDDREICLVNACYRGTDLTEDHAQIRLICKTSFDQLETFNQMKDVN